jgi:acetyl-CoA carboxylase carboxyltransferase component
MVSVVTRKAYGLGAQAMMGGTTKAPIACLSWPTGEFGGMGLEGAVRLGYRKELEAVTDDAEREVLFREMVDRMYAHGKAVSVASFFEIDDVIDPVDTRRWITTIFDAAPETHRAATDPAAPPRRPNIDTW